MSPADVALLRALRSGAPAPVPFVELERLANLTRDGLSAALDDLHAAGFQLEHVGDGVAFRAAPDRLIAADLRAGLEENALIGREIIVLEQTDSTNDFLLRAASPETPEGLVAFAETQTAGRGQHGKQWASAPRRGLWFSILLRPEIALADSPRLTTWIAQTIAGTIRTELALETAVKPPNDVFVGDRKIAGVLVEMRATAQSHLAIAGIGINVNHEAADFPEEIRARAGSLRMSVNRVLERRDLAVAVLRNLDVTYRETFSP